VERTTALQDAQGVFDAVRNADLTHRFNIRHTVELHIETHAVTVFEPVEYIWIKAVRRLDAIEIFYSFDDKEYVLMRNAWMQDNVPVMVGLMAASPDGNGFNATFQHFEVKHLPDARRQEWLKKNKGN